MNKRKSKTCPKYCKEKGCYDTYEQRKIMGKTYWVWVSHCKSLEKLHKKLFKGLKKFSETRAIDSFS